MSDEHAVPTGPVLTLYGRPDCGLCDEMLEDLHRHCDGRFRLEKRDISGDAELERRFALKIPVLALDDEIICYGRLDVRRLDQALAAMAPG